MINFLRILPVALWLIFYSSASQAINASSLMEKCHTAFFNQTPVELQVFSNQKSSYAKALNQNVYQQTLDLQTHLSKSEHKLYASSLVQTIQYFEKKSQTSDLQARINLMNVNNQQFMRALETFPEIIKFVRSNQVQEYKSLDTNRILKLILATFSQHTLSYLTQPIEKLDWARFQLIVKNIADFKNQANVFSLYKIQRAIKAKYSLNEYLNCK